MHQKDNNVKKIDRPAPLSREDFEKLKSKVSLLRISPLRSLVKDYDLPIKGNKSKLLKQLIELFDVARNECFLAHILNSVNELLEKQNEPFCEVKQLQKVTTPNENTAHIFNKRFQQYEYCGPSIFSAKIAPATGAVRMLNFRIVKSCVKNNILIDFSWGCDLPVPFSLTLNNGLNIYEIISERDPCPGPVDITSYVLNAPDLLVANLGLTIRTPVELTINVVEYRTKSISKIANDLAISQGVDSLNRKLLAKGKNCDHNEMFDLNGFICHYLTFNNNSKCPICKKHLNINNISILGV